MKMLLLWAFIVFLAYTEPLPGIDQQALQMAIQKKSLTRISCTPDWKTLDIGKLAARITPLPGTGKWNWKITSTNDSARFYFNQGIRLYYGFHIVEAVPSFRKAQQFDPNSAILYWGEALALGPNINDIGYIASVEAYSAAQKAVAHLSTASAKEKLLIEAIQLRYSLDSSIQQSVLNEQYAAAMRGAFTQFDHDADVGAIYADALMLLHPWDFWNHDGTPKAWTPEIVGLLEKILRNEPNHPGANHYYIHTIEASANPERAINSANRLGSLAPSLSHMVHMPSHIYVRTGDYQKGIDVNTSAVQKYAQYKLLYPAVEEKADLYEIHNRHMQAACAIQLDNYSNAFKVARETRQSISPDWMDIPKLGYYIQYIYLTPEMTMLAFGHWDDLLAQPEFADRLTYARILQHFAKGVAYARKGQVKEATQRLAQMDQLLKDTLLAEPIGAMNAPKSGGLVARSILAGAIAEANGMPGDAFNVYSTAVDLEDAMIYNEPKDWLIPARRFLGEAFLKAGLIENARLVFNTDLKKNPGNLYAKNGLTACNKK
ncbi:tetratricopeptide repeat protein [Flavihumibacter profundi]|uniref:hypothetical protein n=1 Tax=Flavihumibacter profundi TaxID=2716883 RepID=UPI001CC54F8D|nr:hypothetical protein [Flavihumibacter profundi]MBZ5856749.1 hypothetical protein [Flavihumibacter profundi]